MKNQKNRRLARVRAPHAKSLSAASTFALALVTVLLASATAHAQRNAVVGPPPWPGSRVAMVLPLKLGDAWNADQATGEALLRPAEERLLAALDRTGKLGTVRPHRFSPLLVRARDDGQLKAEEFTALVDAPTLENARTVLSKLTFAQPPMIVDARLEEVRVGGTAKQPIVQIQVSGQLYEGASPDAFRRVTVTSNGFSKGRSNFERAVAASDDAFRKLAAEFVRPLEDIALPAPPEPTPTPTPEKAAKSPASGNSAPAEPAPATDDTTGAGAGANGRTPVQTKPLPEVAPRGGLPVFPQGQLPLTPGNANPERFEGMTPAPAAPATEDAALPAEAADNPTPPANPDPPAATQPAPEPAAEPAPADAPTENAPPADAPPADAPPADAPPADAPPADDANNGGGGGAMMQQ